MMLLALSFLASPAARRPTPLVARVHPRSVVPLGGPSSLLNTPPRIACEEHDRHGDGDAPGEELVVVHVTDAT